MSTIDTARMARAYYPQLFELEKRLATRYSEPEEALADLRARINDVLVYAAYFWVTAAVVNEVAEWESTGTSCWLELPSWIG